MRQDARPGLGPRSVDFRASAILHPKEPPSSSLVGLQNHTDFALEYAA